MKTLIQRSNNLKEENFTSSFWHRHRFWPFSVFVTNLLKIIKLRKFSGNLNLGVVHIWRPLWGGGGVRQKWDVIGHRGWGVSECSGRPIFIFLLKKFEFAPRPDIMLSQTLIYYWQEIFPLTLASGSEASSCANETGWLQNEYILKMWLIINKSYFVVFLDNCTYMSIKPWKSR